MRIPAGETGKTVTALSNARVWIFPAAITKIHASAATKNTSTIHTNKEKWKTYAASARTQRGNIKAKPAPLVKATAAKARNRFKISTGHLPVNNKTRSIPFPEV
jgi:hypothetical protein